MKDTEFINQLRTQTEKDVQDYFGLETQLKRSETEHETQMKKMRADIKFLKRRIPQSNKFLASQGQKAVPFEKTSSVPKPQP